MSGKRDLPGGASIDGSNPAQVEKFSNQSIKTFAASLSTAAIIFAIQIAVFLILSGNWKIRSKTANDKPTHRQSLFHKI
jgi:hypothetical protein